jgi:Spy/CpxP family protein refolding chaperone
VLTEEQRRKLREYMQAGGEKLRASQQEVMKLRSELQDSVLNGKADESAIKQKSEQIAKLEAELLSARMSAMAKLADSLTDEQKEKIKAMGEQVRAGRARLARRAQEGPALAPQPPAAPPPPPK